MTSGANLSLYARIDECSTPVRQIHLRITTTEGSGTASWGEPIWDVTVSTLAMGAVPATGSWVRLEVPLDQIGLDSGTVTRIDVTHVDGRVWFDRFATWPRLRAVLTGFTSDRESTVAFGTTVTWTATATGTSYPLEYRFERRNDAGEWRIMQNYGVQNTYSWTTTATDVGTNAIRVSVRNGGSIADFEDTATLLVRVVEGGGEGFWLRDADARVAWWKRWLRRNHAPSVSLAVGHETIAFQANARRHSLYTPELQLLAETEITTAASPPIQYEYVWFAGQPLAQITTATGAIDWYFNDHLGTPILQTDVNANVTWRVEYEPYGELYSYRAGATKHQPLRFPGQENDGSEELSYNIFRWYRAGWGRYTQADPLARFVPVWQPAEISAALYGYAGANPLIYVDPNGLKCCECPEGIWSYKGGSGGFGALIGLTYQVGTYTCESKPSLKVDVKTTCIQGGLLLFINAGSFETSVVPAGIIGAEACNVEDLFDPADGMSGGGKFGAGVSGGPKGATVSLGLGVGVAFGGQKCWSYPDKDW